MPSPLCHRNDIANGGSRGFDPTNTGRDTVFVVRQGEALFGWHDQCPHEGLTPLPYKRHGYLNKAGTRIVCFAHGAQFDIRTGLCVTGPCKGDSLTPLALLVDAQGQVFCSSVELAHSLKENPSGAIPKCAHASMTINSHQAKQCVRTEVGVHQKL